MQSVIPILQELLMRDRNQAELARELGVTQPTVSRWLDGSEPKINHRDKILRLAKNKGIVNIPPRDGELTVPIVGYAGAGGAVVYSEGQGPFGEAVMPPGGSKATVAVVIRGDSMTPQLDDGWIVYYDDRHAPPTSALFGKLCVVGLSDGRILVRKLYPGRKPDHFDLLPTNGAIMQDQAVEWAARISFIAPN
jgi:transcriptional regulator with XRE-family HTH domain